jgi:hypothetical protein
VECSPVGGLALTHLPSLSTLTFPFPSTSSSFLHRRSCLKERQPAGRGVQREPPAGVRGVPGAPRGHHPRPLRPLLPLQHRRAADQRAVAQQERRHHLPALQERGRAHAVRVLPVIVKIRRGGGRGASEAEEGMEMETGVRGERREEVFFLTRLALEFKEDLGKYSRGGKIPHAQSHPESSRIPSHPKSQIYTDTDTEPPASELAATQKPSVSAFLISGTLVKA